MKKEISVIAATAVLLAAPIILKISLLSESSDTASTLVTDPIAILDDMVATEEIVEPTSNTAHVPKFKTEKDRIWHNMLNTVDNFDNASGTFFCTNLDINDIHKVEFKTNLKTSEALSTDETVEIDNIDDLVSNKDFNFINTNIFDTSLYSDGKDYYYIHEQDKTFTILKDSATTVEDSICNDEERFYIAEDNIPSYVYRTDATNAFLAKPCIFPQEMTFGFLTNQELWDIVGETEYLSRNCYVITGTSSPEYGKKLNVSTFEFYVDKETGILLKYCGYDKDENCTGFIVATKFQLNKDVCNIEKPCLDDYKQQ